MKRLKTNRLSIESLERREMLAASAVVSGGVLNITGTEQADRIIVSQVTPTTGLITLKVTIQDIASGAEHVNKSFFYSAVKSIKVECGSGDDIAENNTMKAATMYGDNGEDRLVGGSVGDTLFGGRVYDQVEDDGNTLIGNGGNDKLYGTAQDDTLEGGAGDDELLGGRGNDTLEGGANKDKLWGAAGNDDLHGGDHQDFLYGGIGVDDLFGDDGDDTIYGLDATCGEDDRNFLHGGTGKDTLFGAIGRDELWGDAGNDTLHGGRGDDDLFGGINNDTLYGGDGNDTLDGDEDNDTLHGNNGDDTLNGDAGDDYLAGGDGFDTLADYVSLSTNNGTNTFIFDVYDWYVDGLPGSARWGFAPKVKSGRPYAGHGIHIN